MDNNNLKGKKLLIIGGAFQHCKLVEAAHKMGAWVCVVDYLPLEKAPAKQIADSHYEYNITDIDDIVKMCEDEGIDGVLSSHLDACQLPYGRICERLQLPCFGNEKQFHVLTDKNAFLSYCAECGVDIIPQYTKEELLCGSPDDIFPVFVKPCDSRGSRGQSVCYSIDEAKAAIAFAESESKTNSVVIEKYMGGKPEFTMSYLFIDGEAFLVRTGDRFVGSAESRMDKSSVLSVSPSVYSGLYIEKAENKVLGMLKKLGIKNGAVFMQGFVDGDKFRFFDPGLRFPGCEYDRLFEAATGINTCEALAEFALTGKIDGRFKETAHGYRLNGKTALMLFIVVRPGTVKTVRGISDIEKHKSVLKMSCKYKEGDTVGEFWNVNQRFCEIDLLCDGRQDAAETIDYIYKTLRIEDENGSDMKIALFDTQRLRNGGDTPERLLIPTDEAGETERIGALIIKAKSEIYTPKMLNIIREKIKSNLPNASDGEIEKKLYASVYDYWAFGANIDEEFYYHFGKKSYAEKKAYITSKNRLDYFNYLNKKEDAYLLNNKFAAYKRLKPYYGRDIIALTSENDYGIFLDFILKHPVFVAKPADLGLAIGVHKVDSGAYENKKALFDLLLTEGCANKAEYRWGGSSDIVLEELVTQDSRLARVNASSVNVVRMTTVRDKDGNTAVFCPWIKFGANGDFVASAGHCGYCAGIDADTGVINTDGYNERGETCEAHPDSGVVFRGFALPRWDEALALAYSLANMLPQFGYIGWDFALTDNGYVVIEGNYAAEPIWQMWNGHGMKDEFERLIGWKPDKAFWWQK